MVTVNISIPEGMKADIENVIENDGYGNTSEFFRDLVRGFLEERRQKRIEELLLQGLQSGEPTAFTRDDMDEIRRRGVERLKARVLR
jgi:antitoxin ParD1/3/4